VAASTNTLGQTVSDPMAAQPLILVAEDNRGDIFLIQSALAKHKVLHQLHIVTDGEQAISYLSDVAKPNSDLRRPALILLDLNLPRKSGREVLDRLRSIQGVADTPVIIMSSSSAPQDRSELSRWNARAYFTKPSDLEQFLSIGKLVQDVLAASR